MAIDSLGLDNLLNTITTSQPTIDVNGQLNMPNTVANMTAVATTDTILSTTPASTIQSGDIAGDINMVDGFIKGGQLGFDSGKGFFIGVDVDGIYKLSVGDSAGNKLTWNGTTLTLVGGIDISTKLDKTGGQYATAGSGARLLIFPDANTGLKITDGTNDVFKVLVGGTDVGDVIIGSESSNKFLKWDNSAASLNLGSAATVNNRLASVLSGAIDSSGHFIDANIDTAAKNILASFSFGASGAIQVGTYSAGVSGDIKISPAGIVGRNSSNVNTFTIDGTTGNATFGGSLSAASGSLGTISTGLITLDTTGYIRGGQSAYNTGTGFWLGYDSSQYKFSIGDSVSYLTYDPTNGLKIKGSNNDLFIITASDTLVSSADTERTTTNTSYTKLKEIKYIDSNGTIRVKYSQKYGAGSGTCESVVYVNGILVGVVNSQNNTAYLGPYSGDFTVNYGDLVQLYGKVTTGGTCYIKNFEIFYTKALANASNIININ